MSLWSDGGDGNGVGSLLNSVTPESGCDWGNESGWGVRADRRGFVASIGDR